MYTIDYETHAIEQGSAKSPSPVGVAIKHNGEEGYYLSWGHLTENNCTYNHAKEVLTNIWNSNDLLLFHNAKFDVRISMEWFDLPFPLGRTHDTMFLAFLINPRFKSLGLKQLSEELLDMPPDEQEELRDWLVANVNKATPKNFGAYIVLAPGSLVGKYAIGDVERTYLLYQKLRREIEE